MAGANAYAGSFIGNDFVVPRSQQKQNVVETTEIQPPVIEQQIEQVQQFEQAQEFQQVQVQASPIAAAAAAIPAPLTMPRDWPIARFLNLRSAGLLAALLMSGYLAGITVNGLVHTNALAPISSTASTIQQRVNDNLHHIPTYVGLPSNQVAVENKDLASDLKNIESQTVLINFSFAGTTPTSAQVDQWVSTSAGPKSGTTVITANLAGIEQYLNAQVKLYNQAPTSEVVSVQPDGSSQITANGSNGITYSGVDNVAQQFASQLLKANGVTISVPSTSVPYKTITKDVQ